MMQLAYRVLSTAMLGQPRHSRAWMDPGIHHLVGSGRFLTCFFNRHVPAEFDLDRIHRLPVLVEDYSLQLHYHSPVPSFCFNYDDVAASVLLGDVGLVCIPRVVQSHFHGTPIRLMIDLYSRSVMMQSMGL